ncbi:hypothetical protein [Parazoarcus communis]|jgi:hypothetical protein|nr:hypothetical protein [Parazoarcus communis]
MRSGKRLLILLKDEPAQAQEAGCLRTGSLCAEGADRVVPAKSSIRQSVVLLACSFALLAGQAGAVVASLDALPAESCEPEHAADDPTREKTPRSGTQCPAQTAEPIPAPTQNPKDVEEGRRVGMLMLFLHMIGGSRTQ